ncbi:hypothetical protein EYF80_000905 [Liparis tanakae]|uniref:Uncharacterized protein n=1 Tax=Liparis tanakae TaxID=230148 RepID=A0A4Z2JFK6_9TELE|nr:hypothetical protein EYF80_000905 [Liparis tanakae]
MPVIVPLILYGSWPLSDNSEDFDVPRKKYCYTRVRSQLQEAKSPHGCQEPRNTSQATLKLISSTTTLYGPIHLYQSCYLASPQVLILLSVASCSGAAQLPQHRSTLCSTATQAEKLHKHLRAELAHRATTEQQPARGKEPTPALFNGSFKPNGDEICDSPADAEEPPEVGLDKENMEMGVTFALKSHDEGEGSGNLLRSLLNALRVKPEIGVVRAVQLDINLPTDEARSPDSSRLLIRHRGPRCAKKPIVKSLQLAEYAFISRPNPASVFIASSWSTCSSVWIISMRVLFTSLAMFLASLVRERG